MENKKTVLIVEDDEKYRNILVKLISAEGVNTITASNGIEALNKIKSKHYNFDLIILDLIMPEMSGWNFMYEIPKTPAKNVPILILTNLTEYSVQSPIQLDFMTKANVSTTEVVKRVKKHLGI